MRIGLFYAHLDRFDREGDQADTAEHREKGKVRNHIHQAGFIKEDHRNALEKIDGQGMPAEKSQEAAAGRIVHCTDQQKRAGRQHIELMEHKGTGLKTVEKGHRGHGKGEERTPCQRSG